MTIFHATLRGGIETLIEAAGRREAIMALGADVLQLRVATDDDMARGLSVRTAA